MLLVKFGGSLITDKTQRESLRTDVLSRLAAEIAALQKNYPAEKLIIGHGSGSFGHFEATDYDTASGVKTVRDWYGFTRVAHVAARLNRYVIDALLAENVSVISVQPSASIESSNGEVTALDTSGIRRALRHNLVPVFYGDVSYDTELGGTIASTEAIIAYLANHFTLDRIVLLGEVAGVLDTYGQVIPHIHPANLEDVSTSLRGSHGVDVTGGMLSKVREMLSIAEAHPNLKIHIVDGRVPHILSQLLDGKEIGTLITADAG